MSVPRSLAANPRLTTWLSFDPPGMVSVRVGKVELGQGIATALASIVSFELDVALNHVRMVPASTSAGPNEGTTAGSMSVQESGASLRQVCAEARAVLVEAATAKLGAVPVVVNGTLSAGDESLTYWDLDTASLLDRDADGVASPKSPGAVGSPARIDLPDKVIA
jgi:nicotinate dehydrogenase subunit B